MNTELLILLGAAASIGLVHTLLGPDHYLPFIMMSKARGWTLTRTLAVTAACGIGHVASSVGIGFAGIAFGIALGKLEAIETVRGELAGWALIAFGLVYAIWGLRRAYRKREHTHTHVLGKLAGFTHAHPHDPSHPHDHEQGGKSSITPWVLFAIFVLGPCEPLIPLLIYPAAENSIAGVAAVTLVFGIATIGTMVATVAAVSLGFRAVSFGRLERFTHAIAGSTIALSGLAINFLGL